MRAVVGLDRGGDPELDEDSEMAAAARLVAEQAGPRATELAHEAVDLWSLVEYGCHDSVRHIGRLTICDVAPMITVGFVREQSTHEFGI